MKISNFINDVAAERMLADRAERMLQKKVGVLRRGSKVILVESIRLGILDDIRDFGKADVRIKI